jgi:hypothetical protein
VLIVVGIGLASAYHRAMPDPKPDDVDFYEETDSPTYADDRDFYKVEKWTRDGTKVDSLLYAGNSLGRARSIFEHAIKHRPRIRLTIRQLTRVLDQWPPPQQRM